jgi:LacI family transcriptional regulator
VADAAARIGFRPNALARSFVTGRSGVIGVIIDAHRTFAAPVIIGATTALGARNMAALAFDAHANRASRAEVIATLNARKVDGVLVIGHSEPLLEPSMFAGLDAPAVFVYGVREAPDAATFEPDGFAAGRMAGEHLTGLGRTRISHITAAGDPAANQRAAGLQSVLREHSMTLAGGGAPVSGDWTRRTGIEGMKHLLERGDEIDAVFCGNDQIAWGAYSVLRARGIAVPDDVALMGYDNWTAILESTNNFLTTIDPNLGELGATAADFLIDAITATYQPGGHGIAPTLVPGISTLGPSGQTGPASAEGEDDGGLSLQMWISAM